MVEKAFWQFVQPIFITIAQFFTRKRSNGFEILNRSEMSFLPHYKVRRLGPCAFRLKIICSLIKAESFHATSTQEYIYIYIYVCVCIYSTVRCNIVSKGKGYRKEWGRSCKNILLISSEYKDLYNLAMNMAKLVSRNTKSVLPVKIKKQYWNFQ